MKDILKLKSEAEAATAAFNQSPTVENQRRKDEALAVWAHEAAKVQAEEVGIARPVRSTPKD